MFVSRRAPMSPLSLVSAALAALLIISVPSQAQTPPPQATPPANPAAAPAVTPAPAAATPAPAAPAQPLLPPEVLEPVNKLTESIESAEKSIQQLKELEGELQRLRGDVERIIYDSTASAEALRPQLAEVKSQIEKLGPPPGKDQPPESPTVTAERARLAAIAGALDSAVKTSELAWVRAKQLIDRITVIRYQLFTRNLLERRQSPVLPSVWREVQERMPTLTSRVQYYFSDWSGWAQRRSAELWVLAGGLLGVGTFLWFIAQRVTAYARRRPAGAASPAFFERAMAAAWTGPARMLAPVAVALISYSTFDNLDLLYSPWDQPAATLAKGIVVFAASSILLSLLVAPRQPQWRLVPVNDTTASRILWFGRGFVGVYVLDTVLTQLLRIFYAPLVVQVVATLLTSLAFAALLVGLLLTRFEPQRGPDRPVNGFHDDPNAPPMPRLSPRWIKIPLWLVALAIVGASVLGYVALGRFIAHQIVLTGMIVALAGVAYLAIRAVTRERDEGQSQMGRMLGARFGIEAPRQRQIARLAEFTLTGVLGIVALPALLLQWGFSTADIRDYVKALLFGFEIGQFRISLARILIGVALFTALLFATRLIQRWLRDNVLVQPRMDAGIANSIDTSVGYAGTIVAALVAVSYAGFDVTNLAIVAGALSVGIGFGLQSIVNNFVSGLILLIERPVKVGDWIVVGSDQGNVRRISVRATEIETFDRASLIIPNSELISGRLFNWTHRNLLGRVVVKVTADGKADPDMVLALLKDTAAKEAQRIGAPPPNVSFDQFSSTALDYSVRIVVPDVNTGGAVSSDLRIALMKAMRAAGVLEPPAVAPVEPAATPVTPTPIIPRAAPPVNGAPAKA